jgi:hypothetical protein
MAGGRRRSDPVVAEWPPTGHRRVLPGQGRLGPRRCPLPRFGNLLSGDRGRYVRQVLDSERGGDSARSQGPGDHDVAVNLAQLPRDWKGRCETPSYRGFRYPAEIISHCGWLYHRFLLSLREVQEMMAQRGRGVSRDGAAVVHQAIGKMRRQFTLTPVGKPIIPTR